MKLSRTGLLAAAVGAATLLAAVVCAGGVDAQSGRAPVSWTRLEFVAKKLTAEATIEIQLQALAAGEALRGFMPADAGTSVDPTGPEVILLESRATIGARVFGDRLWLDPATGAACQIVDTENGTKPHEKTYRLTRLGFTLDQREPGLAAELSLAPGRWTRQQRTSAAYSGPLPPRAIVTGPSGLLYEASAAGLASESQWLILYVLVHDQLERVSLHAGAAATVPVDFLVARGGTTEAVTGSVPAVSVSVESDPLDPAAASLFRLFALERDVVLLWDPQRRIPLELTGEMRLLGRIEVRLARAFLR